MTERARQGIFSSLDRIELRGIAVNKRSLLCHLAKRNIYLLHQLCVKVCG